MKRSEVIFYNFEPKFSKNTELNFGSSTAGKAKISDVFFSFLLFFIPDQTAGSGKPPVRQHPLPDRLPELPGTVHPQGELLLQPRAELILCRVGTPTFGHVP